ncbi:MAG TPA: ribosome small subunit-dependent GTPase A [Steroidobacteraceae bacterium]|jgi:ribosome biogenesis GTPase
MSLARVTVTYRGLLHVRAEDGRVAVARPARRQLSIVCGDFVHCESDPQHEQLLISAVAARSTALYRTNARGGGELVAANVSRLLVVVAPLPRPDFFIVDRYLCAARCAGITGLVVLNKSELPLEPGVEQELAAYSGAGFDCLRVSAQHAQGLEPLVAAVRDGTGMLVGQSGVGKSSLLGRLVPGSEAAIGALARDDEGRHTTSATRLYALPGGGELIDSPGVRDFAPAIDRLDEADLGFPEVQTLAGHCRFADCRHLREPQCAVRAAAGASWSARRYESYRRLRRLYQRLQGQHPAATRRRR